MFFFLLTIYKVLVFQTETEILKKQKKKKKKKIILENPLQKIE